VKAVANFIKLSDGTEISASKMLERFLFTPIMQQTQISKLSGGEKKRLGLLNILMTNPNFLILDEPTNDLDIMTLNILEEFLTEFKGCLIIVTHDRYFMDKIVDHLFVFEGEGSIRNFPGNYSQYREIKSELKPLATQKEVPDIPILNNDDNQKTSKLLLNEIKNLEVKAEKITQRMYKEGTNDEELVKLSKELSEIEHLIEDKTNYWLQLQ
jgi:ATP-binding cassette subfamily F protein uup